jgi:hypothetical protein
MRESEALMIEQRFNLKDGQKNITFMGWLLGSASSETPDSVRWTELSLYKTVAGAYVLEKVGRSDVFHSDDCERSGRNGKAMSKGKRFAWLDQALPEDAGPNDPLEDYFVPCEVCDPGYEDSPVWVERDIYSAPVYAGPDKVVDALYQTKPSGRYLSRIARELLEQAVAQDKKLATAVKEPVEIE